MLTAAIVGAGLMGHWHARAASRAGATVALVIDSDRRRAESLARRYGDCRAATTIDALHSTRVHVAHVCTPAGTHGPLVTTALEHGAHVLCEKPLEETATATSALLHLAGTHGRMLCPVHQALFQRGVRHALAGLTRVGRIVHLEFGMCTAGADGRDRAGRDAVVADILPHPLALLVRIVPGMRDAHWDLIRADAGELLAWAMAGTTTAEVRISTHGRPTENAATIIGTLGTLRLDFFHGYSVFLDGRATRARKALQPFVASGLTGVAAAFNLARRAIRRESAYPGLWELVAAFYAAVASGSPPPIRPEETIAVASTRDCILALTAQCQPADRSSSNAS